MASPATEYTIHGVKIKFPCKAYPSQLTMMHKIIKCIEKRQNSLLESPTGSGKSLALLCASLAWLTEEKEKVEIHQRQLWEKAMRELDESLCDDDDDDGGCMKTACTTLDTSGTDKDTSVVDTMQHDQLPECTKTKVQDITVLSEKDKTTLSKSDFHDTQDNKKQSTNAIVISDNEDKEEDIIQDDVENNFSEDADFQAPKKRFRTPTAQTAPKAKKRKQTDCPDSCIDLTSDEGYDPGWKMQLKFEGTSTKTERLIKDCNETKTTTESPKSKHDEEEVEMAPKIFFGTRTHKQITQIVRELNKTCYNTIKMCILASREHTCIHAEISKNKNKNEECRKAVEGKEGKSCSYYAGASLIENQDHLRSFGFQKAWDIEDLVSFGRKEKACPYYVTKGVMKDADIVFCPYNYLIDPIIRSQVDINIGNQIVILDEAHNIEDSSREAASWSVTTETLEEALLDIDYFIARNINAEPHRVLHSVCINMRAWMLGKSNHLVDCDYEKSCKVWDGDQLVKILDELGFTAKTLSVLGRNFKKAMNPKENSNVVSDPFSPSREEQRLLKASTASLFEGLFMVLGYIFKNGQKFLPDYRVGITKKSEMVHGEALNGWRRKGAWKKKWVLTLNFWCLSPAVAFSEIGSECRSVILTSGTLSPMSSFSSELGVAFPIQLEANHVVGKSQVWVGSLSVGPTGSILNATYRFAETFSFQDEVGEAIYSICQVVPHGVLCFLPSYSMLDKLVKRWKTTGLWERFWRLKQCFCEPRGGGKEDFNETMEEFYNVIKDSEDEGNGSGYSGALFLAVCRGKVSEGLDFADNNARAVITVGIPFPNVKDTQVELKRKYNNRHCSFRGLLNGNEWYEIQAYRALNQALGRCIRHKNDWGAILLIDERFGKSPKYRNGLSKWLRSKLVHHNNFHNIITSLKQFAQARLENPSPDDTAARTLCHTPGKQTDLDKSTRPDQESTPHHTSLPGNNMNTPSHHDVSVTVETSPPSCKIEVGSPGFSKSVATSTVTLIHNTHLTSTPLLSVDKHTFPRITPIPHEGHSFPKTLTHEDNVGQLGTVNDHGGPCGEMVVNGVSTRQVNGCCFGTSGTDGDKVGPEGTPKCQGGQRLQRRPMFNVSNQDESRVKTIPDEEMQRESDTVDSDVQQGVHKDIEELSPDFANAEEYLETEVTSPESPLLFATPPSSFGDDQELEDITGLMETVEDHLGSSGTKGRQDAPNEVETFSDVKEEVEKSEKRGKDDVMVQKEGNGDPLSSVDSRPRDLLDMVTCEEKKSAVKWNITCSTCGLAFLSPNQRSSGEVHLEETNVPSDSFLGSIFGSLLSLSKTKKKKKHTVKTMVLDDFSKLSGLSSACQSGGNNNSKQGSKLNSIYCEAESRCYLPLVCTQCNQTRKSGCRIAILAVRAVSSGITQTTSPVWLFHDKVVISSSQGS